MKANGFESILTDTMTNINQMKQSENKEIQFKIKPSARKTLYYSDKRKKPMRVESDQFVISRHDSWNYFSIELLHIDVGNNHLYKRY